MSLRAALLGLLSEGPATGYELTKDFAISTSVVWPAPKGEIYRELAKLEAEGFATRDSKAGVRGQRSWHITTSGRNALKSWLRSPGNYTLRYDPILRAVFLGMLNPKDIREIIAADRAFFQTELSVLLERKAEARTPKKERRRYGLQMAIGFYEAMVKWCDEADAMTRKDRARQGNRAVQSEGSL